IAGVGWFTYEEWPQSLGKKKGSAVNRAALDAKARALLGSSAGGLAEAVAELLDATAHVVDRLLGAGVEGVRFARGVELEQRQFAAVVGLGHFLGVRARTGHELETVRHVDEQDF